MERIHRVATLLLCTAASAVMPGAGAQSAMPDLAWLEGDWVACGEGRVTEERWLGPHAGTMVGVNASSRGSRVSFEFMRIAPGDGGIPSFLAQPGGRAPAVPFVMVESGPQRIVFANPAHDFPQRVLYWREGEALYARVEGRDGGTLQAEQWRFVRREARMTAAAQCAAAQSAASAVHAPSAMPLPSSPSREPTLAQASTAVSTARTR